MPNRGGIVPSVTNDPATLLRAVRACGEALKETTLDVKTTIGDEAADVIRVSFQVIDRKAKDRPGRYVIAVDVTEVAFGPPVNTQTVAVVSGTVMYREIVADQSFDLLTDATGLAEIDVEIAGEETRYFVPRVLAVAAPVAVTWADAPVGRGWLFNDAQNSGHALLATWD